MTTEATQTDDKGGNGECEGGQENTETDEFLYGLMDACYRNNQGRLLVCGNAILWQIPLGDIIKPPPES